MYRKSILATIRSGGSYCMLTAQIVIGRGVDLFADACNRDPEGVVAKPAQSLYGLLPGNAARSRRSARNMLARGRRIGRPF